MLTLNLVHWGWNEAVVEENLGLFAAYYPRRYGAPISVTRTSFSALSYRAEAVEHIQADRPADVLYVSDEWKADWVRRGLLAPLEDPYPPAATYRDELIAASLQDLAVDGKLYGLPYYADTFALVANHRLLDAVGVEPPRTWDEVLEACARVRDDGRLEFPLLLGFGSGSKVPYPVGVDTLYTLAVAMTDGDLFDQRLQLRAEDGGPLDTVLSWLARARDEARVLEPDGAKAGLHQCVEMMRSGAYAFTIYPTWLLRQTVVQQGQPLHGEFRLVPMPGTGRSVGYTRFYGLSATAVDRQVAVATEAAARLIEFLGGRSSVTGTDAYLVAKRWALFDGLGFAQKGLYDDPDIVEAVSRWADFDVYRAYACAAVSRRGLEAPGWQRWKDQAAGILTRFITGKLTPEATRQQLADAWRESGKVVE